MKADPCLIAAIVLFLIILMGVYGTDFHKVFSDKTEGYSYPSGIGSHEGDSLGEAELYLSQYDTLLEGIDPEIQASQDEYVKEQDQVVASRGAAGAAATEVDHYKPPNPAHGLTGFRQFWHQTYALPDARQMPSDDPDQFYSSNPTGYVIGAAL